MKVYVVTMTYDPSNETQIDSIYSTWEKANDRVYKLAKALSSMYTLDIEEYELDA